MADTFFDLQVNGYAGTDFNSPSLTGDALHAACAALEADGVGGILATIITDQIEPMCRCLARIAAARERDPLIGRVIAGIHIEGPFLNPADGYRGAHAADAIRPADVATMDRLLDAASGLARIVTFAPECDAGFAVTSRLRRDGVIVSAGHTDAPLETLRGAIDAGMSMFTHLGNGCPMHLHRHENIIQRVLSLSPDLWITLIADGVHVPWPALKNYLKLIGPDRAIVVTDAMAAAGMGPGRYRLGRWDLLVGEDAVARAPDGSHLVGSAGTMRRSCANLISHLGLSAAAAHRLLADHPRRALNPSVQAAKAE